MPRGDTVRATRKTSREKSVAWMAGMREQTTPIESPTLDKAFLFLCQAIQACAEENQPVWLECAMLQEWYACGRRGPAWRRVLVLLEGVVGIPIRGDTS